MKQSYFLSLFLIIALSIHPVVEWEIIIPTYNNQKWCIKNIESVVNQTYPHWHATIIIDCATDATEELLQSYIAEQHLEDKVTIIVNTKNQGALANIYYAATTCQPHKIIGLLDGDDWLKDDNVLEYLSELYERKDIWLTFGQYELWPENRIGHCRPFSKNTIKDNSFRDTGMVPSHFRTFYAWLFQLIDIKDLMYKGAFYPVTWDMAIMYPLIEMAGKHHRCISEVLYVYNIQNPLNDFKIHTALQAKLNRQIRAKTRYEPLKEKPHFQGKN